jgi:hypothetical protein
MDQCTCIQRLIEEFTMKKAKAPTEFDAGHVPITEEMDSLQRTLPPVIPIVVAFIVVGGLLAAYLLASRPSPVFTGNLTKADVLPVHVEFAPTMQIGAIQEITPDTEKRDEVVVLTEIHISNTSRNTLFVKGISATLSTGQGDVEDNAAPVGDFSRILQAYPALATGDAKPIPPETKIAPGTDTVGAEVFSFQMPLEDFEKRKSLAVKVNFYDRDPLVLDVRPNIVLELNPSTQHEVNSQLPLRIHIK